MKINIVKRHKLVFVMVLLVVVKHKSMAPLMLPLLTWLIFALLLLKNLINGADFSNAFDEAAAPLQNITCMLMLANLWLVGQQRPFPHSTIFCHSHSQESPRSPWSPLSVVLSHWSHPSKLPVHFYCPCSMHFSSNYYQQGKCLISLPSGWFCHCH